MNQILYSKNSQRKARFMVIGLIVFLLAIVALSVSFGIANRGNDKILKGVYINNTYIGQLTKDEALNKLNTEAISYRDKKITLTVGEIEKEIIGADLNISLKSDAVEDAYNYGRTGNILLDNYIVLSSFFNKKYELDTDLTIDDDKFTELVATLSENIVGISLDDTYEITNDSIIITKGHDGKTIDEELFREEILKAFLAEETRVDVPLKVNYAVRIDLDDLYSEVYVEKVDAEFIEGENFSVTTDVEGVSFDKILAQTKYSEAQDDTNFEIELIKTQPDVTVEDLNDQLFKDVLATYTTKYDKYYTNRVTNLEIAGSKINGTILYPDQEFSYNNVVGERTAANGFKRAHIFAGGRVVDGLGGGICQISSTLYNAVLLSNLEVTNRVAHAMHTGYVDPSRDATVVYGSIDFKFKNNRTTPIKIECIVKNGIATVTIYGLKKADEPVIEIESVILQTIPYTTVTEYSDTMDEGTSKVTQSPMNGYVSEAYKIIKDSNGNQVSRTLISKDSYKQTSKIVLVGTRKVEVAPVEPEPTTPAETTNPEQGNNNTDNPYYSGE